MTLTKVEFTASLISKYGFDKSVAKQFVEQFFEEIRTALANGQEVKLSGFGNFSLRKKNARPGRNPKTGESVAVSARRVVVFKPGQKFRERVENVKVKS
ncbi:integration host factor subunit alpha [[Haemophilus] ducreyi]|uniref:integration host factor subunit alpha n=1 Tax=Haemophilus ducreyi TaxID=730 RepID=UPI0006552FF7|nr:integration host factor subunit alpha [[Haemophilus] ducreyi]AKO45660.1 integration host factor subunit alpha [[Haemophilus] ducreyi]AKO47046.1 integration host factor subunit alpha [[Haemophilus] ducreyi]AKO48390.1 integration host factor subunit alpha [[Haemophilus] ducreyi]AKO49777.1 integration host factor subunit alpha [[Haemophilus] ducreyi]ANF61387.1 integration host factor subunit alpha [[Haemophilus] ducreyi]